MRNPAFVIAVVVAAACSSSGGKTPAPKNFTAAFTSTSASLTWDPVAGVSRYAVHVGLANNPEQTFQTTNTGMTLNFPFNPGYTFSVFAMAGNENGSIRSAVVHDVPFTVEIGIRSAHLHWDASAGPARIYRGPIDGASVPVGESDSGDFADTGLTPDGTYSWRLVITGDATVLTSDRQARIPARAPDGVVVSYPDDQQFVLSWQQVPGAQSYLVKSTAFPTPREAVDSFANNCDGAPSCVLQVAAVVFGIVGEYSAPLTVTAVPAKPAAPVVTAGINQAAIDLPSLPANADHFAIERAPFQGTYALRQSAPGGRVLDPADPWTSWFYRVRAVTADGVRSAPSDAIRVTAVTAPAFSNLTGTSLEDDASEGQRVTIQQGGILRAVEVAVPAVAPGAAAPLVDLSFGGVPTHTGVPGEPGVTAASLDPQFVTGTRFDLAGGLPVSAGETLDFFVRGATVALSDVSGTGGHLKHGSLDASHDLVYRLYIEPATSVGWPDHPDFTQGVDGIRVTWRASPGPLRYDIYGADDGGSAVLVGSAHGPSFVDRALPAGVHRVYSVTAVGADTSSTGIALFPATTSLLRSAAQNRGDAAASGAELCSPGAGTQQLAQTFTSEVDGTLANVDFRFESAYGTVTLEVHDATGALLASASRDAFSDFVLPLDEVSLGSAAVNLAFANIPVHVGDKFELRLSYAAGTGQPPCALVRDTVDAYAGGQELRDGVAVSDRDLAFRVAVQ